MYLTGTETRRAAGWLLTLALLLIFPHALRAANNRITRAIDNHRRATLSGNVNPRIQSAADRGPVDPSYVLPYVTLVLSPSPGQQADLDQFLAQLQNPASPDYHKWLTPEQYADRFGVSQADIDKITAWLGQQGLTVKSVARGRNAIAFSGPAGRVEAAFGVALRNYLVNGEAHFANAGEPSIPAALQGVVRAVHGLHDFRMRARARRMAQPRDTLSSGLHQLAPDDVAIIYDINPLYQAGIDGSGQTVVVAGQTQLPLSDIAQFRSLYGLPANVPQTMLAPGTTDPEVRKDDLLEADLDVELTGAVARNATILFVYSDNIIDAVQYAIDQNLAPVISMSYGYCELQTSSADANFLQTLGKQANASGITWFAASGDSGAADCYGGQDAATNNRLSVDLPAALPQVTGVGGTEFDEGGDSYWNTQNTSTHASALSYIPETSWNDSDIEGIPTASGGGASIYFFKPSWQTGTGVPNDSARDVPDVSLSGSADHDGYRAISDGTNYIVGGTSAGPPQFAGIAALLNQYVVTNGFQAAAGLGNMNQRLYELAPVTGIFHDITTGDNKVAACSQPGSCIAPAIGYSAGTGYDLVTGLGSVDVYNLVIAWNNSSITSKGSVTMKLAASAGSLTFEGTTILTATVTSADGGTPTGTVSFSAGTSLLGTAALSGSNASAAATLKIAGVQLAVGANSITAQYNGDTSYDGATAAAGLTITSASNGAPSVTGVSNAASFTQAFAAGAIISVFGRQLAPATTSTPGLPLPTMLAGTSVTVNGVAAPLYYVSPAQLNVQIPYEVTAGTATLKVNNNGESVFITFSVSAAAPGIFMFENSAPVPFTTAAHGQVITLYMTGAGAVTPPVPTGAAPAAGTALADLPAPLGAVQLTVGGAAAAIDFIGIPTWSVGVLQINYSIPTNAPLGSQQVIVSIGGTASAPTQLTVTQ